MHPGSFSPAHSQKEKFAEEPAELDSADTPAVEGKIGFEGKFAD